MPATVQYQQPYPVIPALLKECQGIREGNHHVIACMYQQHRYGNLWQAVELVRLLRWQQVRLPETRGRVGPTIANICSRYVLHEVAR